MFGCTGMGHISMYAMHVSKVPAACHDGVDWESGVPVHRMARSGLMWDHAMFHLTCVVYGMHIMMDERHRCHLRRPAGKWGIACTSYSERRVELQ